MIENKVKESFNHTKLNQEEKNRIYEKIIREAASTPETIEIKSRIGRKNYMRKIAAACVAIGLAGSLSVGAYAGYKWLAPSKVAIVAEDNRLAKAFGKTTSEIQIQENDEYRVVNLGIVSGKDIGHEIIVDGQVNSDRTYVAVAIERKDKTPLTDSDASLFVCPLVKGIRPWQYYRYQNGRDATYFIKDGILYFLAAGDNIEKFAANQVYLAVQEGITYSTEAYNYDEQTGEITINSSFKGLNMLFDLQLDKSKADEKAAQEIIDQAKRENAAEDAELEKIKDQPTEEKEEEYPKIHSSATDQKNNLKLNVWDGTHFRGIGSDDEWMKGKFSFFPEVIGEGIDTITYSLDKGIFYKKIETTAKEAEKYSYEDGYAGTEFKDYIGCKMFGDENKPTWLLKEAESSYTVKYEEQNTPDHVYGIQLKAEVVKEKAETEESMYDSYRVMAEELAKRSITATIQYKDGHTITKKLAYTMGTGKDRPHKGKLEWK